MPRFILRFCIVLAIICSAPTLRCFADSQIRIVRLSDVEGKVDINRNTGNGYEKAFLNLPITQSTSLRTNRQGLASIEFEDGSAIRLSPSTQVNFPQLLLKTSGNRLSTIDLQEGTIYVNFLGSKDDEFTIAFGEQKITLSKAAHLRIEQNSQFATVAVLRGEVEIDAYLI